MFALKSEKVAQKTTTPTKMVLVKFMGLGIRFLEGKSVNKPIVVGGKVLKNCKWRVVIFWIRGSNIGAKPKRRKFYYFSASLFCELM
jgi:hypothetical protein